MNELIVLEQLPVIKYRLEQLSVEIKEKVDNATNLIVTEDTVKDVKQVRAELTKEFNELESQRKMVKNAIMQKYDEFEEVYKENVSTLYKNADATLKEKIDNVENQLKEQKREELFDFAMEYFVASNIQDIVKFEDIGLNITLSASMKSLKQQIIDFVARISNDMQLIRMEEYRDEILIEYKKCLSFIEAKTIVVNRYEELEKVRKQQEAIEQKQEEEQKNIEKVEEIITPPKEIIEDEEIIEVQFTVKGTKEKIKKIKDLIVDLGVEYR